MTILQREPFVAKPYAASQSKTDLYLVMRYIDGGDCAALDNSLDAKGYIADVWIVLAIIAQQVCRIRYRFINSSGGGHSYMKSVYCLQS